ncbi:ABC transporter permease [Ferviditalea candida]|uniref:ABC transporter permease n=1 Tax=Ferviditalea candida TaxID=3108399 RepID=A0ABU5ZM44_9BACL|nr:ABC transporter permease [Paenibacillaceae bacterium T2]
MKVISNIYNQKVLLILLIMFVLSSLFAPYFLTWQNISTLLTQSSIFGIMALGMTFVILAGEFDLSVGAVMAFSGVFAVKLAPYTGIGSAILIVVLSAALAGLLAGLLVTWFGLNSFMVSLCSMFFFNGLALAVSGSRPLMTMDPVLDWLGNGSTLSIPNMLWLFAILFVITEYVLRNTKFGRNVYAVGGDEQVARLSGIPVRFYKISVFVISGFCAGIGGILLAGMLNSASPTVGEGAALSVIFSVVIGGTSLAGGEGSAIRTVMGLFIFGILDDSLSLLNVPGFHQSLIKGVLLVVVIGMDYYSRGKVKAYG